MLGGFTEIGVESLVISFPTARSNVVFLSVKHTTEARIAQ